MKFQELLVKQNSSQRDLANALSVSQPLISFWCTGKRVPRMTTCIQIAEVLKVDVQEIIDCFIEKTEKE